LNHHLFVCMFEIIRHRALVGKMKILSVIDILTVCSYFIRKFLQLVFFQLYERV